MKKFLLFAVLVVSSFALQAQGVSDTSGNTVYRESYPKINDLVHTRLDAKFDFAKSYLYGNVTITLKPHIYAVDSLQLDAKGMDIAKVSLAKGTVLQPLKFTYDGWILTIRLDKKYKAGESYTVNIVYTAKPNEVKVKGSDAITDAKGLYFINPKGEDKDKPTQVWTQGETEGTSVWCPTIDKPDQKTTDEILMTVPDKYVTLSNGRLASQKKNPDGTRTDDWKMELPHSPYLFFMGVGDYAIVRDKYKGKEVNYYVEKEYASTARKIFGLTPAMIAFYEKITGVAYPWIKYSQIVGRDYVSGAMENTTCTLHQESAQQDARQLIDGNGWESVIAHELFHQWFGDYVTCESWSNLTVNESFAEYSQYLWKEHQYGADAAAEEGHNDMFQYLSSPPDAKKDLVRFYYADKEDMFDLVSYQKGGRVLHMLRTAVGDSAFFKGLNLYLTTNKFKNGEAHQLRLALEETSGRDLNWFFNQWYFGSGHPKVTISYHYDDAAKKVSVTIRQTQGGKPFEIPLSIDVYEGTAKVRHEVRISHATETFTFPYNSKPELVNVDATKYMLWEKLDNKTLDNFIFQYAHAGTYEDRLEAIEAAAVQQYKPAAIGLMKTALRDKFDGLRNHTLDRIDFKVEGVRAEVEPILVELARSDKKSTVRAKALDLLGDFRKPEYKDLFLANTKDSSYSVAGAALKGLLEVDSLGAMAEAKKQAHQKVDGKLAEVVTDLLIASGSEDDFEFIARQYGKMPLSQTKFQATVGFGVYLAKVQNTDRVKHGVDLIVAFRESVPKQFRNQTDPTINGVVLGELAIKKDAAGAKEQADYIRSQIPK